MAAAPLLSVPRRSSPLFPRCHGRAPSPDPHLLSFPLASLLFPPRCPNLHPARLFLATASPFYSLAARLLYSPHASFSSLAAPVPLPRRRRRSPSCFLLKTQTRMASATLSTDTCHTHTRAYATQPPWAAQEPASLALARPRPPTPRRRMRGHGACERAAPAVEPAPLAPALAYYTNAARLS